MEKISAAALLVNGEIWFLPPPTRHCHLIAAWCTAHWKDGKPTPIPRHEQGFVTTSGRFVEREEAKLIAAREGQLLERASLSTSLFSEDVW